MSGLPTAAERSLRRRLEEAKRLTALQVDTLAHAVGSLDDEVGWARLTELGTASTVRAQEAASAATLDALNATLEAVDVVGDIVDLPGIRPGQLASGKPVRGMFAATRDIVARRMTAPDTPFPVALDASAKALVGFAASEPHRIGRDGQLAVGLSDDRFNRYRRVAVGNTCTFCLMLASRGAVYLTAASAGQGRRYHHMCDCFCELIVDQDAIARSQSLQGDWRNAIKDPQRMREVGALRGIDVPEVPTSPPGVTPSTWQRGASGAPLERQTLTRIAPDRGRIEDHATWRYPPEQVAQEIERHRGNAYAYGRQAEQAKTMLEYNTEQLKREKAYLLDGGVKPQALRGHREYREAREQVKYWTDEIARLKREVADALAEADHLERTGLTRAQYEAAERAWEASARTVQYRDGLGVLEVDEVYAGDTLPNNPVGYTTALVQQNLYEAMDSLPQNVRDHVLKRGYSVAVNADAENMGAAAFTYAGTSFRESMTSLVVTANPRWTGTVRSLTPQTKTLVGDLVQFPGMSDGAETFVHEIGHMVDRLSADEVKSLFDRVLASVGDDTELLSGYGRTNDREMVAETFVRWVRGDTDEVVQMVAEAQRWADL